MSNEKIFFKKELEYDYEKYCYFYDEIQNKIEKLNKNLEDIDNGDYPVYLDAPHSTTNLEHKKKEYLKKEKNIKLTEQTVFSQWKSHIFKRRISFENETIYIVSDKLKSPLPNIRNNGVTILSRHDEKYISISQIDINEEFNNKLGKVELVGNYKLNGERDILHTDYHHYEKGRKSFDSAKEELSKRDKDDKKNDKIDVNNFFRLAFKLAEQGLQSKALYHENSSIIDGSAGTGKSTTAIQKLEYYHKKLKIPQEKLLILVKNIEIKKDFESLLQDENLELNQIQIKTPNELIPNIETYNLDTCIEAEQHSKEIKKIIENFTLNYDEIAINYHYKYLYTFIGEDKFDSILEKDKKVSLEIIKKLQLKYENTIYKDYLIAFEALHRYKNYYDNLYRREEKIIKLNTRLLKLEQKQELNSFSEKDYQLYDRLEKELFELEATKINEFTLDLREKNYLKDILFKVYFNPKYISNIYLQGEKAYKKRLLLKYLNFEERRYDTIVVDEAQDYASLAELELIRLEANRIIYTGDILQNIGKNGIEKWEKIHNINKILDIEKDKFELKHNFRQTYQLANASYNYRQLLLGGKIEDIGSDYYDDEKELNGKPYELVKIIFNQDTQQYIKSKIEYIKNRFTSQIPIVLIYKTKEEKEQYQKELSSFRLSDNTEQVKEIDVILVNILEAKGKQFPVVLSNLEGLTDREIYLIMTRGQFEVEFLSFQKDIDNEYLETLYINDWIEVTDIAFNKKCPLCQESMGKNIVEHFEECIKNATSHDEIIEGINSLIGSTNSLKFLKELKELHSVIINRQSWKLNDDSVICGKCKDIFKRNEIETHQLHCDGLTTETTIVVDTNLNKKNFCEKCNRYFNDFNSLDQHMASKKHKDTWEEYFSRDEVKERLKEKNLIHNHEKGQLVKENHHEDKKSKINYDLDKKEEKIVEDIVIQDEIELSSLENGKDESENFGEKKEKSKSNKEEGSSAESIQADLLEAKEKHQGEVKQIDILLEPNVVSDIDAYIKKVQEEYEKNIKNAPTTVTTHIVNKKVKIGRKKTKEFLTQQYKGFCQICGFSFTTREKTPKQYFELFDWFSEKITKQKVNVVQAGSSLCLCARCHSGVKYGSFTTDLVHILKGLDVKKMSFDEFVSKISVTVDNKEIPESYDFIENDMYKVDIRLFNQEEFIFYTEEHFLHLFVMLRSGGE